MIPPIRNPPSTASPKPERGTGPSWYMKVRWTIGSSARSIGAGNDQREAASTQMLAALERWCRRARVRAASADAAGRRLLLDDPDLDLGTDIGMQADRHAVDAERPDRLVEVDLALLDVVSLGLELLRDVRGGHRPEQLPLFTDARREGERNLGELVGDHLRLIAAVGLRGLETLALLLDAFPVARRRLEGVAAGEEKVACVARGDLHEVPGVAEVVHGPAKN